MIVASRTTKPRPEISQKDNDEEDNYAINPYLRELKTSAFILAKVEERLADL